MKEKNNIFKTLKTSFLLMLLMVVFLSKGTVSDYQEKILEVEQSSEQKNKENSNQQINTIEFEATISVFSLHFLDFSDFIQTVVAVIAEKNKIIETSFFVSYNHYFRILFSRIMPINAP